MYKVRDLPQGELALCYVKGDAAYFTTRRLGEQWGDDWSDAPYEHNSGEPYEWLKRDQAVFLDESGHEVRRSLGSTTVGLKFLRREPLPESEQDPHWDIVKVMFEAGLMRPSDGHLNSPFSVEQINAGAIAWLRSPSYEEAQVIIPAGSTLWRFVELIGEAGGCVFMEIENPNAP